MKRLPLHAMDHGLVAMPTMLALGILIERLGGEVVISQDDIDKHTAVPKLIMEGFTKPEGHLVLCSKKRSDVEGAH